jgi:hypothetical protein
MFVVLPIMGVAQIAHNVGIVRSNYELQLPRLAGVNQNI